MQLLHVVIFRKAIWEVVSMCLLLKASFFQYELTYNSEVSVK